MRWKTVSLSVLAAAVLAAAILMSEPSTTPMAGQPVGDEVAATIRGGTCSMLDYGPCPGNGMGCPSGMYVISGKTYNAEGVGDIHCGSTCGSYFSSYTVCGS